jgi:diguanylate cyclase (GGDEF)-like protein
VLVARGADILHFYRSRRSSFRTGRREIQRFGVGVVIAAVLWAAFPILTLSHLNQTGRAYTAIVLCGMVGGSATVLAPSKTLSLIFCGFLVLPTATLFLSFPGVQNTFLGILGFGFFAVMVVSSRVTNRATMTAVSLSRANESLVVEMEDERRRTEAANIELKAAQFALGEANRSLERRIQIRTADLENEMREKERYAKELAYLASTDPLTELCNRSSLRHRLSTALAAAARSGQSLAVLFLDLDKFKEVNDILGHMAGDRVLQVVAQRLVHHAPAKGDLARWGGDEFVVTLPNLSNTQQAMELAALLNQCLADPIEIEGGVVGIDATIGIALFPDHGRTEEELIRAADVAMYAAKEERRSKIRLFDLPLGQRLKERHTLERALREAIDSNSLSIVFQPIVGVKSGVCETLEALARWNHPQRGPIPPAEFIPLAERTGEIVALGRWILLQACRVASSWPGSPPPSVSVNVSAVQIEMGSLVLDVAHALRESGLPPRRLQLELTESVFAGDRRNIIPTLTDLRETGVKISLDDFGTGFSCLADLRRLPVDSIKIDKSFVELIEADATPIVKVIVATAQTFGLEVVAEGVETASQAQHLTGLGVHYLQGYFFSRTLTPEAVGEWLIAQHANRRQQLAQEHFSGG